MEKNGSSSRFVLVMAMLMIINILSVSQVKGAFSRSQCLDICNKACKSSPVYDYSMKDCMMHCETPSPPVSQAVHYCNLGCATSLCSDFVSAYKGKMEGCVESCSKSSNKVYTQDKKLTKFYKSVYNNEAVNYCGSIERWIV